VALVVGLASTRQCDLDLRLAVLEVDGEGDEGERLLSHAAPELFDLTTMEEEFAGPIGVDSSEAVRVLVRGDVRSEQPHLAPVDAGVRVLQCHLPGAQGLDLGAAQLDPAFERLENVVVMTGPAVLGDPPDHRIGVASLRGRDTLSAASGIARGLRRHDGTR